MKYFLTQFFSHKTLYVFSISIGGIFAFIVEKAILLKESTLFGLSILIWLMAFGINLIDIYTGIKADTKRKQDLGEKFVFQSKRGWRAIEKIFVFTFIIAFLHVSEKEAFRWSFNTLMFVIIVVKLSLFFYTILIEIQSIGENEEVRFGKKGRVYKVLDSVIEAVNEGLLTRLRRAINGN